MNVSCPECRSVFRVDPAKVPSTTVRARCSVCGGVITVSAGASIEDEFSSNSSVAPAASRSNAAAERVGAARGNAGLATALMDTIAPPAAIPRARTPAEGGPTIAPSDRGGQLSKPLSTEGPSARPTAAPASAGAPAAPRPPGPINAPQPNQRPVLFPPRPMMPGSAPAGTQSRPLVAPRPAPSNTSAPAAPVAASPLPAAPRQSGGFAQPSAASSSGATRPASAPPPSTPAPTGAATPAPPRASSPAPSSGGAPPSTRTPINPFLANDPHAKARRLARALVSDLVTYFPQKRQDGLRDGTLKQLFKDEIQKSYEEYVAQVGREFAETTPHFQEALNDLLAGGQKVF